VEEIDGMLSYMIESMRIRALKAEHNDSTFDSTSRKSKKNNQLIYIHIINPI